MQPFSQFSAFDTLDFQIVVACISIIKKQHWKCILWMGDFNFPLNTKICIQNMLLASPRHFLSQINYNWRDWRIAGIFRRPAVTRRLQLCIYSITHTLMKWFVASVSAMHVHRMQHNCLAGIKLQRIVFELMHLLTHIVNFKHLHLIKVYIRLRQIYMAGNQLI